jgi:hypothetical protein
MTEPKNFSAEEFVDQWEGMQKEFVDEDFMFRLDIPSLERTKEWIAEEKPVLKVVHKVPPPWN